MHKSTLLIERIKKPEGFEQFLKKDVLGRIMQIKGFIRLQLTNLTPIITPVPDNLSDIHMMIECYFSPIQDVEALLTCPKGIAFYQTLEKNPYCQIITFIGHEHNLMPRNQLRSGSL